MDENDSIQLFEDRKIRTAWDEEREEWYFSAVDVIAVLTGSPNPTDYLKKMRKRDELLAAYLGDKLGVLTKYRNSNRRYAIIKKKA